MPNWLAFTMAVTLMVVVPIAFIAGAAAFIQLDVGMLNPANWHASLRLLAVGWALLIGCISLGSV